MINRLDILREIYKSWRCATDVKRRVAYKVLKLCDDLDTSSMGGAWLGAPDDLSDVNGVCSAMKYQHDKAEEHRMDIGYLYRHAERVGLAADKYIEYKTDKWKDNLLRETMRYLFEYKE